jgi:hypothetical protein
MNRCLAILDRISGFHVCRKSSTENYVLRLHCLESGDPTVTTFRTLEDKTTNNSTYGTLTRAYFLVPVGAQGNGEQREHLHHQTAQDPKPETLFRVGTRTCSAEG